MMDSVKHRVYDEYTVASYRSVYVYYVHVLSFSDELSIDASHIA